jgi:hypothetical protein
MKRALKILAVIITISFIGFKFWEYKFALETIPDELSVYKILYRKEHAWGFGPGGNETGIRVYELPEKAIEDIQKQGIEYFRNLPSNTNGGRNWRGRYQNWFETPIEVTRYWTDYMSLNDDADYSKQIPSISNYMNAYGFGLDIKPEIKKLADDAITNSGNYYAYGRIGIIIVIPKQKRVIYAYNG